MFICKGLLSGTRLYSKNSAITPMQNYCTRDSRWDITNMKDLFEFIEDDKTLKN